MKSRKDAQSERKNKEAEKLEGIEKIAFDQYVVVLKGKVRDWKKVLEKFKDKQGRFQYRKLFKHLINATDILDNPYTYVIFLRGEPIYVGETAGGSENRGIAILAIILDASNTHDPLKKCIENKKKNNEFGNDDEIGILIISTRNKDMAKILERVLIVGLPLKEKDKPDCNND